MNVATAEKLVPPPPSLPARASLFLDFDGTLVELAERPDAVVVGAYLDDLIACLRDRLDGRVVIVTGRAVKFVRERIGVPGIGIAGSHGQELYFADGTVEMPDPPAALVQAGDALDTETVGHPGVIVERKPFGVALHYRQVPGEAAWCHARAEAFANALGLKLQPGKMMIELRAPGADKGGALRRFLGHPAFAASTPVMLGDDLTDEPAFAAARDGDGWGLLVGAERESAARYRLAGVPEVHRWLAQVAAR